MGGVCFGLGDDLLRKFVGRGVRGSEGGAEESALDASFVAGGLRSGE